MSTIRLSSRGEGVLPKRVRERHQWAPTRNWKGITPAAASCLGPAFRSRKTSFAQDRAAIGDAGNPIPTDRLTGAEDLRRKDAGG